MKRRSFFLLLLILFSFPLQAGVFKCVHDGKTTYSQKPCEGEIKEVKVVPGPNASSGGLSDEEAQARKAKYLQQHKETGQRLKKERLELRVFNLERKRDGLIKVRDKKIADLQKKFQKVYNFRQREVISSQIREVRSHYWVDRRRVTDQLKYTQMELIGCCD